MSADDDSDDLSHVLKKNVRNVQLDVHNTECALVVRYEMEAAVLGANVAPIAVQSKHYQKIIRLKDLNEGVDIASLARYIIQRCPIIPEYRVVELEQILFYLEKRQHGNADNLSLPVTPFESVQTIRASITNVEDYIEMLYEDIPEKTKGTAFVLQLSKNAANIRQLVDNETLIGALARVLRDDWKKSFELATNIVSIFLNFSVYSDFHSFFAHHKVGALCLQLVEYELKRWDVWSAEARSTDEKAARRWILAIRKQQLLLSVCLNLLLNLADDIKVEGKMVSRDIVRMLGKCASDRDAFPDLLLVATLFLLKLSLFVENREAMESCGVVENVSAFFPTENVALRNAAVRLLFNLSFEVPARTRMVTAGLVSHIAPLIDDSETAVNLMYQLSINDDAKAMVAFTDIIQTLMKRLLSGKATEVVKALLVNIALEKRNAQLICGADGRGLDLLMESALANNDQLLMKVLRNIASHTGPTEALFTKWVSRLLEIAKRECEELRLGGGRGVFGVECLGTVNLLCSVDWAATAKQLDLVDWIRRSLSAHSQSRSCTDFLLQLTILCGTMARQLEAARLLLPLVDQIVELLSAQQEDDEMVVQVVYLFYALIVHEELSESLMGGSAQVGAYLIDLMHDRNAPIRAMCDRALALIAERREEWARKMDVERFRWHNAQWLEMVGDSEATVGFSSASGESGPCSESGDDVFNEVFGAEEILDDTSSLNNPHRSSSALFDRNF